MVVTGSLLHGNDMVYVEMRMCYQEPEKPTYCLDDMKPFKRPAAPERARSTPQTGLPEFHHPATKVLMHCLISLTKTQLDGPD